MARRSKRGPREFELEMKPGRHLLRSPVRKGHGGRKGRKRKY